MAPRILAAAEAAGLILDNAVVTVSSSSGLGCPDAMLAATRQIEGATRRGESVPGRRHPIAGH